MVYPDGSDAKTLPGSVEDFTLEKYRDDLGKPYARVMLLLSRADDTSEETDTTENMSDESENSDAQQHDAEESTSKKNLPSPRTPSEAQRSDNASGSNENLPGPRTSTTTDNNSGIFVQSVSFYREKG